MSIVLRVINTVDFVDDCNFEAHTSVSLSTYSIRSHPYFLDHSSPKVWLESKTITAVQPLWLVRQKRSDNSISREG